MHYLTGWFIRNPVAANLLVLLILALGAMTLSSIRIEGFPRIPPDSITIVSEFPDSTAEQVDELVTEKITKSLEGLEGVRSVVSVSEEGFSTVTVRKTGGQSLQKLVDKIRMRVDGISDLPSAVRRPIIEENGYDFPALYINLHGKTDPATLQTLADRFREELLAHPDISKLKVWGLHSRELQIEVDPMALEKFQLTIAEITQLLKASSLNFKSGSLKTSGGYISLNTDQKSKFAADFAQLPILTNGNGAAVTLGDIATVRDAFEEGDYLFRFNGELTAGMEILVGRKENLIKISEIVHQIRDDFSVQLPAETKITIWGDSSFYISDRLNLLKDNGVQGLLLVLAILALFLNVRLAFWVAMGIPVAVLGAVAVFGSKWVDYSLNDVTTFGLIIVLGILVDDAVVVGESVFEERSNNSDPVAGTEAGVRKVAVATVFGVLTTVAAFFPLLLLENPLGKVLAGFSGVVILALLFSLLESKFILPAHLAHTRFSQGAERRSFQAWIWMQRKAHAGLCWFRDRVYAPILMVSLHFRLAVLIIFLAAGTLGMGLIGLGKIGTTFFPEVPGQIVTVSVEMDARVPFQHTKRKMEEIRQIGEDLSRELQSGKQLENEPIRTMFLIIDSAGTAQIFAELSPVDERPGVEITDVVKVWRERTGEVEGALKLEFSGTEEIADGFRIKLYSKDVELLKMASGELKEYLEGFEGVSNVRDDLVPGKPQLEIRLKPEAKSMGFDLATLAEQIGNSYAGAEVHKISRERREWRVLVRYSSSARDTVDDFLKSKVRNKTGDWIALQTVADIKSVYVSGNIYRHNGKRTNTVRADIDRAIVSPEELAQAVFEMKVPKLSSVYPGVEIAKSGELEEIEDISDGMKRALLLAALLIYVLMAVPLKSYWQPFVILAIVPFGYIGAALGHLIMDLKLSIFSFFGMMALTGVVINDSLVMMTRYNQARESGMDVLPALKEAGIDRFRAIFLTTATTVIGLSPLLMETSEQAQYLIPAAASLAFGELFSTFLMLILVPVIIAISEDVKTFFSRPSMKGVTHVER